jgi:hypothetical protein
MQWAMKRAVALLAVVNSPRVAAQRPRQPARNLRQIARIEAIGPIRPWKEVVLHISAEDAEAINPGMGGKLTGSRALHFVRRHFRIVRGQIVWVRPHSRGDKAKGIIQKTYKLD